jgi:glycosyltransferase involved in cell wall biosynthesis
LPPADGYRVNEAFYRRSAARADARGRRVAKGVEHLDDMLRFRRASAADVVHYQWLTFPALDARLLPPTRPRVLTPHGWLRREAWATGSAGGMRRLLERMDAVVALSEYGARVLREEAGLDPARVRVIPHGALDYLTELADEASLPAELAAVEGPVILFFGLIRPYKGVDVLLKAFRTVSEAELWIVGRPLGVSLAELEELARRAPRRVRFVSRFVADRELPAYFRRADLVVLPYRDAEQSGVLYTALAFGKPTIVTDVGGFGEVAASGAAQLVPPDDPPALAATMTELLDDPEARERLAAAARAAAAGPYSWDEIARTTLGLYRELGAGGAA